jgi:hypothetical protein
VIGAKRTLVSVLVSVALVATAVVSTWLMASAGVFTGTEQDLPSAPEASPPTTIAAAAAGESLAVSSGFQVSQPRDPFEPLIASGGDGGTTTTTDPGDSGATTTTQPGATTTTQPGATTTTTVDNDPDGIRVVLLEVRTENGSRVAVVEVDGETSTVGVGDTFATSFKVVSLTDNGGVFTFGDSAFTLAVGQSILK